MKPPFQVASFEGYRSAIVATLAPRVSQDTRGIEVRLNARQRHIDVVVFRVGDDQGPRPSQAELEQLVALLASQFADFADYTAQLVVEPCAGEGTLSYRGVPVWERAGTRWELGPASREVGLLVQAG
jgi:hypothetical protein